MDHLRFVERQVRLWISAKHVACQLPAVGFELFSGPEEMGVVGHVEHRAEPDTPRVFVGLAVLRLADEYGDAPVDCLGQLGVAAGAEGRAGAGVGIQQRDVFR